MNIDPASLICGIPAKNLRSLLRRSGSRPLNAAFVAAELGTTEQEAQALLDRMEAEGLVLPDPHNPGFFDKEVKGNALANSQLGKRLSRAKADAIFADFLARVHSLNATDTFTHRVGKVILYGSYLTGASDVGDIDLVVLLQFRFSGAKQIALDRAASARSKDTSMIGRIYWGATECQRFLQGRERRLHLLFNGDNVVEQSQHRVVFPAAS